MGMRAPSRVERYKRAAAASRGGSVLDANATTAKRYRDTTAYRKDAISRAKRAVARKNRTGIATDSAANNASARRAMAAAKPRPKPPPRARAKPAGSFKSEYAAAVRRYRKGIGDSVFTYKGKKFSVASKEDVKKGKFKRTKSGYRSTSRET